jgi:hypothetical protein
MPDRARDAGDADQEHDRPGGEQETQTPHQQAHYRRSIPILAPRLPALVLASIGQFLSRDTDRSDPAGAFV